MAPDQVIAGSSLTGTVIAGELSGNGTEEYVEFRIKPVRS